MQPEYSDDTAFSPSTDRTPLRTFALLSAGSALLLTISLLTHQFSDGSTLTLVVAFPGRILFRSLHIVAWWAPLFFAILTTMILLPGALTWSNTLILNVVHLPMLTIGVIARLISAPVGDGAILLAALERSFSIRGALLICSLLLAAEAALLLLLLSRLSPSETPDEAADAVATGTRCDVDEERENIEDIEDIEDIDQAADREEADEPDLIVGGSEPLEMTLEMALERLRAKLATVDDEEPAPVEPLRLHLRDRPVLEDDQEILPWHQVTSEDYEEVAAWQSEDEEYLEDDGEDEFADDLETEFLESGVPAAMPNPALDADILDADELDQFPPPDEIAVAAAHTTHVGEPRVLHADSGTVIAERTARRYVVPVEGVLNEYGDGRYWEIDEGTRAAAEILRITLQEFGIQAEVTGIRKGPVITMFEILPAPGVKLAKITNLADNIALRLAASSVRIVAPIPGKHAVGIEIPNKRRSLVSFGELLQDESFYGENIAIPIALGKDIPGEAQIIDLTKTPHLLIAGATGSGKSVCVNSIICSILYRRSPAEVRLILIDPKIVELKFYNDIPHLLTPVITDPKRAFQALQYLLYEMERRYSLLDALGVRDIGGYNAKIKRRHLATEPLPYIVVLIDEFADLMATSGKELESTVARLAAMSRAVGIHLVLATQRPSTDVITGLIKANIPSRIAFMVASKIDSRIIIDAVGAEKLLGRGDMLFTSAWDPFPLRMQGAFLSDEEVERVVEHVKQFGPPDYIDDEIFIEGEDEEFESAELEDPLMERAMEIVQSSRKASASYLQRRLKVGYNRAARMVEEMERIGVVGPQNGSKPREVMGVIGG